MGIKKNIGNSYGGNVTRQLSMAEYLKEIRNNGEARAEAEERISAIMEMIRKGLDEEAVRKIMHIERSRAHLLYEIAHARIQVSHKFSRWDRIWMDSYLARYSTPEIVCEYRSRRIQNREVIDIGSGGGIQTIFFGLSNSRSTGIEIKPERYLMADLNRKVYEANDVRFILGDAYKAATIPMDRHTVIFSDPARPEKAAERTVSDLTPSPLVIMNLFSGRTRNFVFDLPPQIRWENIGIPGEKEYISISGEINRLTLYTGELELAESSAVILPQGVRYQGTPRKLQEPQTDEISHYIYLADPSLIKAKLLYLVTNGTDLKPVADEGRRYVMTSPVLYSKFPGEVYEVEFVCEKPEIQKSLQNAHAGRVIPRFRIEDTMYYEVRNQLEQGNSGDVDIYLFQVGQKYVGGTRIA